MAFLWISLGITLLSISGVLHSMRNTGVPFSNGPSNKTRMLQRYQISHQSLLQYLMTVFEVVCRVFAITIFITAFKGFAQLYFLLRTILVAGMFGYV